MKLEQLMEKKKEPDGSYVAVEFDKDTRNRIAKYILSKEIPNRIPRIKMHCTTIYSKTYSPDIKPLGDLDPHWIGKPTKFDVFDTQDGKKALVLLFDCDKMDNRHKALMKEHPKLTYDYPEYKTHITVSYDCGDFDPKTIDDIDEIGDIVIINEYGEDLNTDWNAK